TTQAIRQSDGAIVGLDVTMQASASRPDGGQLTSITFARAVNGGVQVDGRGVSLPATISLPSPRSWSFRLDRVDVSQPFLVDYTVRDPCGEVVRFAGAGTGDGRSAGPPADRSPPTPTSLPTMTATPTLNTTATSTPSTTATSIPTATVTSTTATTATASPTPIVS